MGGTQVQILWDSQAGYSEGQRTEESRAEKGGGHTNIGIFTCEFKGNYIHEPYFSFT